MKIYADCADLEQMESLRYSVSGFTTNPSLMRAAGVVNYEDFAKECADRFPEHSLSFEVIADYPAIIEQQARKIASWGDNVFVKVPAMTTNATWTTQVVERLSKDGIRVNVTAVFAMSQIDVFAKVLADDAYLSVFAGRIADTGCDPTTLIRYAAKTCPSNVAVLWASTREVYNITQAQEACADIITVSPDLLAKYRAYRDREPLSFSKETVEMFKSDAIAAGYTL